MSSNSQEIQNWILTTGYRLVSYQGQFYANVSERPIRWCCEWRVFYFSWKSTAMELWEIAVDSILQNTFVNHSSYIPRNTEISDFCSFTTWSPIHQFKFIISIPILFSVPIEEEKPLTPILSITASAVPAVLHRCWTRIHMVIHKSAHYITGICRNISCIVRHNEKITADSSVH